MDNKKGFRSNNTKGGNGHRGFRNAGFVALLILFGLIIFAAYGQPSTLKTIPLSEAVSEANSGQFQKIEVDSNQLTITKKGEDHPTLKSYSDPNATQKDQGFKDNKAEVSFKQQSNGGSLWENVALSIIP